MNRIGNIHFDWRRSCGITLRPLKFAVPPAQFLRRPNDRRNRGSVRGARRERELPGHRVARKGKSFCAGANLGGNAMRRPDAGTRRCKHIEFVS